jgi:hypothetical protein
MKKHIIISSSQSAPTTVMIELYIYISIYLEANIYILYTHRYYINIYICRFMYTYISSLIKSISSSPHPNQHLQLQLYIYAYIYACKCIYTSWRISYLYMNLSIYTYVHICEHNVYEYMKKYIIISSSQSAPTTVQSLFIFICNHKYVQIHTYICIKTYAYVYIHMHMFIGWSIWIYIDQATLIDD